MARSVRTATWSRRIIRRSPVRIAIPRQTRTEPECRILPFARHLPHAGSLRRLGATTVIRINAGPGPNSRASATSAGARVREHVLWGTVVGLKNRLVHRAIPPRQRALRCLFKLSSAVVVVLCLGGAWHVSVTHGPEPQPEQTSSKPSLFRVRRLAIRAAKFGSKATPGSGEKRNH